jgi:NADH dehydrogenase
MILVTGGTGVVGTMLLKGLHENGEQIRLFTLPDDPNTAQIREFTNDIWYGDIRNPDDVNHLCDGVDTLYHLAAIIIAYDPSLFETINVQGTRTILSAAEKAGVRHFIYVSSASVIYPKPTPYSVSKIRCEAMVTASSLTWTIVRPTLVYDKRKGGLEFDRYLEYLQRFPVVPFIGAGAARKRPVFVGDLIQGLAALLHNRKTYGKIYNFSGGEAISMKDFSRLCLSLMGNAGKPIIPLPVWVCRCIAWCMKGVMKKPLLTWQTIAGIIQDADLDIKQAQEDLGYAPKRVSDFLPECFPRK